MSEPWDVVVVGGGFAGVSGAAQLEAALPPSARILVLEAADRLGGRARSFTPPRSDCALDLGAHYFGRDHERVVALAQRVLRPDEIYSHVDGYPADPASRTWLEGDWRVTTKKTSFFQLQGLSRKVAWDHKVRIFESLLRYLELEAGIDVAHPWRSARAPELDAITFADWVASQRVPTWIREMWGLAVLDIISIRPEQISMLYWLWYAAGNGGFLKMADDHRDGPQELAVTVGMQGLLERFAAERTSTIRTGVAVEEIDHHDPLLVQLGTSDGERIEARHVVVTGSPHAVGQTVRFTPELSRARRLIHEQPVAHAIKAVFVYDTPWWREGRFEFLTYTAGSAATGVEWALDTSDPMGRQRSLSTFVSPHLIDGAGADPDKRRAVVCEAMAELCGDRRAGQPAHLEIWDWRDQPWVRGGPNTSFGPGVLTSVADVWNRPEGPHHRVRFASSEYSPQYPGYVEGALAAGELAASQVATALRAERGWPGAPLAPPSGLRRPRRAATTGYRALRVALTPATLAAGVARQRRRGERPLGTHA